MCGGNTIVVLYFDGEVNVCRIKVLFHEWVCLHRGCEGSKATGD